MTGRGGPVAGEEAAEQAEQRMLFFVVDIFILAHYVVCVLCFVLRLASSSAHLVSFDMFWFNLFGLVLTCFDLF